MSKQWPWSADTDPINENLDASPKPSVNSTLDITNTRTNTWDKIHKTVQPDDSLRWISDIML